MGACFSSDSTSRHQKPSSYVVSVDGKLRQFPIPVTVSQVLRSETSNPDSFFLCNSDRLYFDHFIPSLDLEEELEPSQIYFVLPRSKLQYRLVASNMAALAVKASVALQEIEKLNGRWKRKARISPALVAVEDPQSSFTIDQSGGVGRLYYGNKNSSTKPSAGLGVSRSGSVRKLTRYSSRRVKSAARSFRFKLKTIYEGSALMQN